MRLTTWSVVKIFKKRGKMDGSYNLSIICLYFFLLQKLYTHYFRQCEYTVCTTAGAQLPCSFTRLYTFTRANITINILIHIGKRWLKWRIIVQCIIIYITTTKEAYFGRRLPQNAQCFDMCDISEIFSVHLHQLIPGPEPTIFGRCAVQINFVNNDYILLKRTHTQIQCIIH